MIASAQISVYPLRQERLAPAVEAVQASLAEHGLVAKVGPMSTTAVGEDSVLFAALRAAFARSAELGQVVMTITVSNACPIPE
jgi:uncharacterized protein YqgV (UPF0045/DUF77 family)